VGDEDKSSSLPTELLRSEGEGEDEDEVLIAFALLGCIMHQ